jgi:hypothetical protein
VWLYGRKNKRKVQWLPTACVCAQLGYHGVVVHGDGGPFVHSSVYSYRDPLYITGIIICHEIKDRISEVQQLQLSKFDDSDVD